MNDDVAAKIARRRAELADPVAANIAKRRAELAGDDPRAARVAAAKAGTLPRGEVSPEVAAGNQEFADSMSPSVGDRAVSAVAAFGAGAMRGAANLAGLPGTGLDLANRAAAYAVDKTGLFDKPTPVPPPVLPTGREIQSGLAGITGGATEYRDPTTLGKYAGTVGEFIGGGAGKAGIIAGIASEAAGQATEGTKLEPWARFIGAMAPAAIGTAWGAAKAGTRAAAGLPRGAADPERLALAKVLDDFNIPISAGQRVGADALRKAEGGTAAGLALNETQAIAFTREALKTAGTTADKATREVMAATAKRIGGEFDDVMRGVDIIPEQAAVDGLSGAMQTYRSLAPKAGSLPIFGEVQRRMSVALKSGNPIPAGIMSTWRSNLSKLTASPDVATRDAATAALESIDDAMNSTLTALGRTEDIARLATARGQWRNYLALQQAVTMAGEDAALGIISPARLASAVTRQGRSAVATGRRGDIGALADAGVGVMSPLPTVTAGGVRSVPGVSALLGGGVGAATGSMIGPIGSAVGAAAGMAAPAAMNALRMTGPVQNALARAGQRSGGSILSPSMAPAAIGAYSSAASRRNSRGK